MIRQAVRGLVILMAVALVIDAAAGQQPAAIERITVRNKKDGSTKDHNGLLKFGPAGLQIVGADNKVILTVSPHDVVRSVPGEATLPGVKVDDIDSQLKLEDKKTRADYEKARLGYQEMLKKAPPRSKYLDFKLAQTTTRVADETGDDEGWPELAASAVKLWDNFVLEYKGGWEAWAAAQSAARLLAELNRFEDAARIWGRLMKKDVELSPDLRVEVGMQEIDAQIRSKAYPSAIVAVKALGDTVAPGPMKEKLAIYELAAKACENKDYANGLKAIEAKIAATKDKGVQGVAYSMRGELYLAANKPSEAKWEFMWADTVFNQDRDEAFKAMCRVVEAFKAEGDEEGAKRYRERIRRFRGTF